MFYTQPLPVKAGESLKIKCLLNAKPPKFRQMREGFPVVPFANRKTGNLVALQGHRNLRAAQP